MKTLHPSPITLVGHRGAALEAPENTLAGFRHAVDLGLRCVEFDIRLTADDQLAVIHDATVDRTTNGRGRVADHTMDDLARLDARAIHDQWPEPCPVPSLAEVLAVLAPVPELLIEIKADTPERLALVAARLVATLDAAGRTAGVVAIAGTPALLEPIRAIRPDLPLGIAVDGSDASWRQGEAFGITHALISLPNATAPIAAGLRERGWGGVVGPVNDEQTAHDIRPLGFSHPYSDAPSTVAPMFSPASRDVREVTSTHR